VRKTALPSLDLQARVSGGHFLPWQPCAIYKDILRSITILLPVAPRIIYNRLKLFIMLIFWFSKVPRLFFLYECTPKQQQGGKVKRLDHDARPVMTSLPLPLSPLATPSSAFTPSIRRVRKRGGSHELKYTDQSLSRAPGRSASGGLAGQARKVSHCRCCYTSGGDYLPRRTTTFPQRQCAAAPFQPVRTSISFITCEQWREQAKQRHTQAHIQRQ
jgi:hypothetical protein